MLAALLNACKLTGRDPMDLRVLVIGLGAAGVAVTKILLQAGVRDIIGCDSRGIVSTEREDYLDGSMNADEALVRRDDEPREARGRRRPTRSAGWTSSSASPAPRVMPADALKDMRPDAMVFAMANPTPEVSPEEARPYARIIATGRSDYPNQINNVLAFPGIFRGALDVRAPQITEEMKMAAARAIAQIVADHELREEYIIPSAFNRDVAPAVAAAVAAEARLTGAAPAEQHAIGFAPATSRHCAASERLRPSPRRRTTPCRGTSRPARTLDRRRRAAAGPVPAAVDPDARHPELLGGDVIVEEALRDVQDPLAWDVDRLEGQLEPARARLVGARLLGGDDPGERVAEPLGARGKEIVVAVGDRGEAVALAELRQRRGGVREGRPVDDRTAEGRGALSRYLDCRSPRRAA